MNREELLDKISFALARRGEAAVQFGSVATLRRRYPGIPRSMKLAQIAEVAHSVDLEEWRSPRKADQREVQKSRRKSLLSDEQILAMADAGATQAAIARKAGVSRARISALLKELRSRG